MNRLNGANCLVYSEDGKYKGEYTCVVEIEDNQNMGILENTSISNRETTMHIKNMPDSLMNCRLIIFNCHNGNYYVLRDYVVKNEKVGTDEVVINDDEQNIISKIESVDESEYQRLKTKEINNINWNNINTNINGNTLTKDKVFENLCVDLINAIKLAKEGAFHPNGGLDAGRDYIWKWSAIDNAKIDFLDLPDEIWVMQCKYSENPKQVLTRTETWNEIVKVLQHNPNHYIIFTNRKITAGYYDWWNGIANLDERKSKFIPFTLHLVNKDNLEKLLDIFPTIKEKYFKK